MKKLILSCTLLWASNIALSAAFNSPSDSVIAWITTGDRSQELKRQSKMIPFGFSVSEQPTLTVDSTRRFQSVDGFGYTLTGGTAELIRGMDATSRTALLKELFGNRESGIGISYLRLSMGASDLSREVFSYADMPSGKADPELRGFSLAQDTTDLVPLLQEILSIDPSVKLMASPWSPPVWMKDNGNSRGGRLLKRYYGTYALYFVKYMRAMAAKGIYIDAVTIQNEPQHGGNVPSMLMSAAEQAEFIRDHLGPAFRSAGLSTRIVIWDHNCNHPEYPVSVLNDPKARLFIDGSAFHLYEGDISALSVVKEAHPDKNLYFTEQWTGAKGSFDGDLEWHLKNVIIGSMRNWSRIALEWNLASDPSFGPHTPGGCTECKGALTISGSGFSRNVSYYIIAHASRFVPPGSVRIASDELAGLPNVAFLRPDGKQVLIVVNEKKVPVRFNITCNGSSAPAELPGNAVATYVW